MAKCTMYRVSTITANGSINRCVDLEQFFKTVELKPTGFIWTEYIGVSRGANSKKRRGANTQKRVFDNQVTVIYKFNDNYQPNVKLFRNGNVHLTGIKNIYDGKIIVKAVAEAVSKIIDAPCQEIESEFKIRMINSDFAVSFEIKRKNLHNIIIHEYNNVCSFQPETYPGVKIQYFYNNLNSTGHCVCPTPCFGKGTAKEGNCKKVTIAVFQSGKILITGANTFEQVEAAYNYICKVLTDNVDKIVWVQPKLPVA